jgi:hypothetical protein
MSDDLIDKLETLGYLFVKGTFGTPALRLELAIREFQTYAKLKTAARLDETSTKKIYADRLVSHALTDDERLLTEVVSGEATPRTRELIDIWHTRNYRCPVVVECWRSKRNRIEKVGWWARNGDTPLAENLWLWDEAKKHDAPARGRRMFVRDFTGRFDQEPFYKAFVDADKRLLLGRHNLVKDEDGIIKQDGPMSGPNERAIRITPELLTSSAYSALDRKGKVTYRVVRAVAEAECTGFFDTINCWDKALVSLGLCHWTIAHLDGNKTSLGELEAFFAYLRQAHPTVLPVIVGDSGVEPLETWLAKGMLNDGQRKFNTQFAHQRLVDTTVKRAPVPMEKERLNFFRSWHWFYRFVMATRINPLLQRAMWDMARFRLRDIGEAPAGLGIKRKDGSAAKLKHVFTSEQSTTILTAWHVLSPSTLFSGGKPTSLLESVIKSAKVDLSRPADEWSEDDEARLIAALKKKGGTTVVDRFMLAFSCRDLRTHPHPDDAMVKALSARRDSFVLDDSNLGMSPF